MSIHKLRSRRAVPLRVGDIWVRIGPESEVSIAKLSPRPTMQKPRSQAVTLSDGRTITEATLRSSCMRKQEYRKWSPRVEAKFNDAMQGRSTAAIIPFPTRR